MARSRLDSWRLSFESPALSRQLDYTIVRPGGLKADPPAGGLFVSGENTLTGGEISRDLVADVCVAAISDPKSKNLVVEIVETEKGKPGAPTSNWFNGIKM